MPGGLMILNPRKSRTRRRRSSSHRRRKMTAKQLRYFGPRKSRTASAKRRRGGKKPEVVIVSQNPRRGTVKRKRRHKHRRKSFFKNPRRRSFRRNPISSGQGFLGETFVPAAIGAAGAVGTDLLLGMLPVPMMWRGGPGTQTLMRILASLGVGWVVGAVTNERAGGEAAAGGIIVALYSLFKPMVRQSLPFPMARYVPMGSMLGARKGGNGRMRRYVRLNAVPRYLPRRGAKTVGMKGMGAYVSPARNSGPMSRALSRYVAHR